MRVLILAQYFPPDMGGGATRAYNVAKGLLAAGCKVVVVTAFPHYPMGDIPDEYRWKPLKAEYVDGLRVIRTFILPFASEGLTKRIFLFLSFLVSSLFALPFVGDIDIIWASNPNVIVLYPSLVYKIFKHCPIIQNIDDLWPESLYDLGLQKSSFLLKIFEYIAGLTYRVSSAITPISPAYVEVLTNKYKADNRKIHVIPSGVDLEIYSLSEKDFKKRGNKFRVLYIGAFSPAYDFKQVFSAAKVLESYPDIEFIIQGGGELAKSLKFKAKKNILKNIFVVNKIVSREEVAKILHEADALLLPLRGLNSVEQGISSKIYEYQAVGKPIICCSKGMPRQYISKTGSGVIVEPSDYEGLARAVLFLKDNPDLASEFGENGRKYVEDNLSIKEIGLKMKKTFERVQLMIPR